MIKYNLKCQNDHEFESWFSNSSEFEKLKKKKTSRVYLLFIKKIDKSIMALGISSSLNKNQKLNVINKNFKDEKNKLLQLRKYIENNFDYVGKDFSKKVREIYYDNNSKKAIYGTTTPKERAELAEEGINLLSIPWVNKDN